MLKILFEGWKYVNLRSGTSDDNLLNYQLIKINGVRLGNHLFIDT